MDMTGMKQNKPLIIGVTGGVGAGKSTVLDYLKEKYHAYIIMADEVAKELLLPGEKANIAIQSIYPKELFEEDGSIRRQKMAEYIFANAGKREEQNRIVFPMVKEKIVQLIDEHQDSDIIVVEAALLIEEHYDAICDVMWYIYSSENNRRKRLKMSRGYSEERIELMMKSQLRHQDFLDACEVMIDNDGSILDAQKQVDEQLYNMREK